MVVQSLRVGLIQTKEIENFGSCPLLFNEQTITWSHNLTAADDAVQFIQACDSTIGDIHGLNNTITNIL